MTHNPAQRAQIAAIRDLIGRGWSRADVRALSVYQTDLADEAFRLECNAERAAADAADHFDFGEAAE